MKLDELSNETLNMITPLLDDRTLCALRFTNTKLWKKAGSNRFTADFLCRAKVRRFKLIPVYLIERILRPQSHAAIERLLELIPAIQLALVKVMSGEPHAEWVLYALLNLPNQIKACLGKGIASTTDSTGCHVYHYYALAGHWATFKEHMENYHPDFHFDYSNACYNEIGRKAILGGHLAFYQNLVAYYGYPDYTQDINEALFLLADAVASGKLDVVKSLMVKHNFSLPLDFDYLANAIRLGHADIYAYLTSGEPPFCVVDTPEKRAEVFTTAAQFDNVEQIKSLGLDFSTSDEGETVRSRALIGGSKKVLAYLADMDSTILVPKGKELPALLIAAENKQVEMCQVLISKYSQDPLVSVNNGQYSIHFAACGGDYDCYQWLAQRYFADRRLLATHDGETPLHFAAKFGRYWFLVQALQDFGAEAFLAKTTSGETLLHYAFQSGNFDVIDFLLKNCELTLHDEDNSGHTPLSHFLLFRRSSDEIQDLRFIKNLLQNYGTEPFQTANDLLPENFRNLVDNHTASVQLF